MMAFLTINGSSTFSNYYFAISLCYSQEKTSEINEKKIH